MKKLLLAGVAAVGLTALPGIAHATLSYTIINGPLPAASFMANPGGFASASSVIGQPGVTTLTPTSTVDTLNFNSGAGNTLGTFFGAYPLTPPLNAAQQGLVMSTANNATTTFITATETYNDQAGLTFNLTHDDGATIFVDGNMICGTPAPTSTVTQSCTLPAGAGSHSLVLYYEESFGPAAVLQVALPTEAAAVPEPASLALLGSALVGFGVWRRRRRTS